MAVYRVSNDGRLHVRFSYLGSTYIESIHFNGLLPGQKVVAEAEQGEEITDFSDEAFEFGEDTA